MIRLKFLENLEIIFTLKNYFVFIIEFNIILQHEICVALTDVYFKPNS